MEGGEDRGEGNLGERLAHGVAAHAVVAALIGAGGATVDGAGCTDALAELMTTFVLKVGARAGALAKHAGRQEGNVVDMLQAIREISVGGRSGGVNVTEALIKYMENTPERSLPYAVPPFPVENKAKALPTFRDKGKVPPSHIPEDFPAFPPTHTYRNTALYRGQEGDQRAKRLKVAQQMVQGQDALRRLDHRLGGAVVKGNWERGKGEGVLLGHDLRRAEFQRENLRGLHGKALENPFVKPPEIDEGDGYAIPVSALNALLHEIKDGKDEENGEHAVHKAASGIQQWPSASCVQSEIYGDQKLSFAIGSIMPPTKTVKGEVPARPASPVDRIRREGEVVLKKAEVTGVRDETVKKN